ncbi:MAG: 2-phospho-L-lactate transferase CofD family protein, partial [Actinomycetia bacterium]|nr:2-phospho-L-lactate transferase CofD family protein [Actinomycetes bacterium]
GAKFTDGVQVLGQTKIVAYSNPIEKVFLVPDNPPAYTGVLKTCKGADIIILGPGSLFSSIIPNLLVKGVAQSIKKSKARKIYICNIMTQPGETDNFTVADHLFAVEKYLGCNVDSLIINSGKISENLIKKHSRKNSFVVVDDSNKLINRSRIIREDTVSNKDHVRHDPEKISRVIFESLT